MHNEVNPSPPPLPPRAHTLHLQLHGLSGGRGSLGEGVGTPAPLRQRVQGDVVGPVLAVGVGEHPVESREQGDGASHIGPQEEPPLVVVVGVEVVPDDGGSLEHLREVVNGGDGDLLGDHFRAWWEEEEVGGAFG